MDVRPLWFAFKPGALEDFEKYARQNDSQAWISWAEHLKETRNVAYAGTLVCLISSIGARVISGDKRYACSVAFLLSAVATIPSFIEIYENTDFIKSLIDSNIAYPPPSKDSDKSDK